MLGDVTDCGFIHGVSGRLTESPYKSLSIIEKFQNFRAWTTFHPGERVNYVGDGLVNKTVTR